MNATPNPNAGPTAALREAIAAAIAELHPGVPAAGLERPPRPEFGDYSTNVAMLAAPLIGEPPRDVAARLIPALEQRLGDSLDRIEVAGPGFLNLHMSEGWFRAASELIADRGRRFGSDVAERRSRVLVEFVSANPTGPLTVASGRHLAYGDSLARILEFDSWASERSLHDAGATEKAIADLRGRGLVYDHEGAVWLRTSEFGDDKDRVLIRADGAPTYFAADIAYHRDKLERGFDLLIDVLGADHHGYVDRMRAAIVAFGAPAETFEVSIMQMVNLVEAGERARMSKRRGDFARLDDLLDDIGVDATRFFMLMRSHETPIDIDLGLARTHSSDNPVYYAQYAHARVCSLFRTAGERGRETGDEPAPEGSLEQAERALIGRLLEMPDQIRRAATRREPHGISTYVREIAADFHAFYRDCRVIGAGPGLEQARLTVSAATRDSIATLLGLLGVEAPEEM